MKRFWAYLRRLSKHISSDPNSLFPSQQTTGRSGCLYSPSYLVGRSSEKLQGKDEPVKQVAVGPISGPEPGPKRPRMGLGTQTGLRKGQRTSSLDQEISRRLLRPSLRRMLETWFFTV